MNPMRILHSNTEKTWRGGEQQVLYLMRGLAERGHENILAAPPGSEIVKRTTADICGEVQEIPFRGEWDLVSAYRLFNLARKTQPHVLHAHTSKAHTMGVLVKTLFGLKIPLLVSRRVCFPIKNHGLNRWKYGNVDCFLPISKAVQHELVSFGIPQEKCRLVNSSIDLSRFRGASAHKPRKEFSIKEDDLVIGNMAFCDAVKSQTTILNAARIVLQNHPRAHFFIVGDGPLKEDLKTRARELGIQDRVHIPGFRREIKDFLKLFDIFVMVPTMEGLGSAILEAEALSLPIVATSVGGIPEIVKDKRNGFLIPCEDENALAHALSRLIESQALRMKMGEESYRMLCQAFTTDTMINKTEAVYKEFLTRNDCDR
ncbi:glycosyltransferase [bacterium]|nr:glycosyltransferase [bacterium]